MERKKEIDVKIGHELIDKRDNKQAFISDMTDSSIEVFKFDSKLYHTSNIIMFKKWYSIEYFFEYFTVL